MPRSEVIMVKARQCGQGKAGQERAVQGKSGQETTRAGQGVGGEKRARIMIK